ncbi:MAG: hypothetical protein F6K08_35350 [Okeania sp. SIO1H6]|nr:hypothetical protein [Okeania sp. SIO1H6]
MSTFIFDSYELNESNSLELKGLFKKINDALDQVTFPSVPGVPGFSGVYDVQTRREKYIEAGFDYHYSNPIHHELLYQYNDEGDEVINTSYSDSSDIDYGDIFASEKELTTYVKGTNENDIIFGMNVHWPDEEDIDSRSEYMFVETIKGNGGNDLIYGRDGENNLEGGNGNDTLFGGEETDTLKGQNGDDVLISGPLSDGQSDVIAGGGGADTVILGEINDGYTYEVGGGQFDWASFAFSIAGDVSDLAFTYAISGIDSNHKKTKLGVSLAKETAPMIIDSVKAMMGYEDEAETIVVPPKTGKYATVKAFNPREDVLIVPMPSSGNSNVIISDSTIAGEDPGLMLEYDDAGTSDYFGYIDFDDNFLDDGTDFGDEERQALARQLTNTAIVVDSSGMQLGAADGEQIELSNELKNELSIVGGTKFWVFGANSGKVVEMDNPDKDVFGTNYNDILSAYNFGDSQPENANAVSIYAFDGDDVLYGGSSDSGTDYLFGGIGKDTAAYREIGDNATEGITVDLSETKTDTTYGVYTGITYDGFGYDNINYRDKLFSIENLWGSDLDDNFTGDSNDNELVGFAGDDSLTGNGGDDILNGGDGNDTLNGNNGDDILNGGKANDFLSGNKGDDQLTGGLGNDTLIGGWGSNTLSGGNGVDSFYLDIDMSQNNSQDLITDFNASKETITLEDFIDSNGLISNVSEELVSVSQDGSNLILSYDNHDFAILENVSISDFSLTDNLNFA